ncbi:hypothetical protein [Novosphingobium sp. KACC 22771]|uniref:hypothetical protein n=1 Tax=Novosphingobium sp. KACC 22771 TaxID=3025670 RepID=UPI002366C9BF|nr:hypothetical protein [Novosphingobium sp. KACC 22771]WDF73136.1 hypothetical protein PQ467_03580 [Novosphingobium sp. KACC 22771]
MSGDIDEATLDVLLRVAGLAPPPECRAGIMANLALLARHGAHLREIDDCLVDPAELIAP